MKLIGMLDSPYVRRVAISLKLLKIDFEHQSLSVFGGFDEFQKINPVVKAPTLVLDDGHILMDSTLILEYLETIAGPGLSLIPQDSAQYLRALRLTGLALAACEKAVQIVYERKWRPVEKQHEPWVARVSAQLLGAYTALEAELASDPLTTDVAQFNQACVTVAVAWQFTGMMLPQIVAEWDCPHLQAFSALAEQLPVFVSTPPV